MKIEHIVKVVLATCVLHNFLRRNNGSEYIPSVYLDGEDIDSDEIVVGLRAEPENLLGLQRGWNRNPTGNAK